MKKSLASLLMVLLLGLISINVAAAAPQRYQVIIPAGDNSFGAESGGLSAFEKDGKWGVINRVGDVVIPFTLNYDWVGSFHNGLAQVRRENEYGFINISGKEIVPPKYVKVLDFRDGIALVCDDKNFILQWGAIDMTGKVVIPVKYHFVDVSLNGYNDGDNVNNEGYPFKDGLAAVKIPTVGIEKYDSKTGKFTNIGKEDPDAGKLGFINKKGQVIIPFSYKADYDNKPLFNFNDGLAWVPKGAKYGAINTSGKTVIPFDYDGVESLNERLYHVWVTKKDGTSSKKVINSSGKVVFNNTYDIIHRFEEEGYAQVSKNNKWGLINTAGKVVIPLIYDQVSWFSEGLVLVKKDGKFGYLNKSGQEVIPLSNKYQDPGSFWGGIAPVKNDSGDIGFINMQGELVVPYEQYRDPSLSKEGGDKEHKERYWFVKEGAWGRVYDANGKPDDNRAELINSSGKMIKNIEHYYVGRFIEGFAVFMVKDKDGNLKYGLIKDTAYIPKTASAIISAVPTASKVLVNGKEAAFDAYTISGTNYFKLRDIAQVVNGSAQQFDITWDNGKSAINLVSGHPYSTVSGELAKRKGTLQAAALSYAPIYKDGDYVMLRAYTINNNNYVKLRDLGQAFGFNVSWDGAKNAVVIKTTAS